MVNIGTDFPCLNGLTVHIRYIYIYIYIGLILALVGPIVCLNIRLEYKCFKYHHKICYWFNQKYT